MHIRYEENIFARMKNPSENQLDLVVGPDQRAAWMEETRQFAETFLQGMDDGKAFIAEQPTPGSLAIDGTPHDLAPLLKIFEKEVVARGLNAASGGHLGYIPGGGLYASALADFLAAVTNEYAGVKFGSPGAVQVEHEVLRWISRQFGFPEAGAAGNLTSGGSIANLIAITAARDRHQVLKKGSHRHVVYISEQAHHCILKAFRIVGLGDIIFRQVALDKGHRMRPNAMREAIASDLEAGLVPFMVIATAGTTDTGAVDPLDAMADIAEQYNMWYHIDAAYGGFFIMVDALKPLFKGIERAQSLVVDPHKGLFLPYGVGAVLIQDQEAVRMSHHYTPNYLQDMFDHAVPDSPTDLSPELTKHFRGLRVWLPLQLHGDQPFIDALAEKIELTNYFRAEIAKRGFNLGPIPDLSVSYFWYPAADLGLGEDDVFNAELMKAMHADGEVFHSSTTVKGKFVIRVATLSFRTTRETMDRSLAMIDRCLARVQRTAKEA
jgi:aromatic-L-amino-acid decarboxylase